MVIQQSYQFLLKLHRRAMRGGGASPKTDTVLTHHALLLVMSNPKLSNFDWYAFTVRDGNTAGMDDAYR